MFKTTLLFVLLIGTVHAATIHVPANYPSIQAGIDAAVNGDVVLVAPGTYVENIRFNGKAITVSSAQGPEVTVIDGGSPADPDFGSTVLFQDGEVANSIIQGFTLTQGTGTMLNSSFFGGGVCCYETSPSILDNIITGNTGEYGGGIYSSKGNTQIFENRIVNNLDASKGGGVYGSGTIQNCHIEGNTAYTGGGMFLTTGGFVSNSYFTKNSCTRTGGAICISLSNSINISDNYFYDNSSETGGAIGIYGDGNANIKNNHFFHNKSSSAGGAISVDNYYSTATSSGNQFIWNQGGNLGGAVYTKYYFKSTNDLYYRNSASWGGVVYNTGEVSITNATFLKNFAYSCGVIYSSTHHVNYVDIVNSIFWDNTAQTVKAIGNYGNSDLEISYSDVEGGQSSMDGVYTWGDGMIDLDPLFADPSIGDAHLTYSSPCKDSGNNSANLFQNDFEGDPRKMDDIVDIGADEFHDRLYIIGLPKPGLAVDVKMIGVPNTAPVYLWVSSGVLFPPISTVYGFWQLTLPVVLTLPLGALPSPSGSLGFTVIIPPNTPIGDIPLQGLIGNSLTNLCVLPIR